MLWRGGVPWDELDFRFLGGSNRGHLVDLRKKHCAKMGHTAHTYRSFTFFTLLIANWHLALVLTKMEGS